MALRFVKNYSHGIVTFHLEEGRSGACMAANEEPAVAAEFYRRDGDRIFAHDMDTVEVRGHRPFKRWTCRQCWHRWLLLREAV